MKIIMFAKHLKEFDIPGLVAKAKEFEIDGFDFPVREGYAVNPDNIATALPELVKAMESEGLCVPMCTGEGKLLDPDAPDVEPLLAAMAESNVRLLKLGYYKAEEGEDYWQKVDEIRALLAKWERLAEKHDVTICYHTHSGSYMGCTAAGLMHLIRGFDPNRIGGFLDAGHLGVAGEPFPLACAITAEYLKIVALKDLRKVWVTEDGKQVVKRKPFPIGEGVMDMNEVFPTLAKIGFDGPLTIHIEYKGTPQALMEGSLKDSRACRAAWNAAQGG